MRKKCWNICRKLWKIFFYMQIDTSVLVSLAKLTSGMRIKHALSTWNLFSVLPRHCTVLYYTFWLMNCIQRDKHSLLMPTFLPCSHHGGVVSPPLQKHKNIEKSNQFSTVWTQTFPQDRISAKDCQLQNWFVRFSYLKHATFGVLHPNTSTSLTISFNCTLIHIIRIYQFSILMIFQ